MGAEPKSVEGTWWFQVGSDPRGPVTADELRALRLPPDALVWREDFGEEWKRYDQTELRIGPPPVRPGTTPSGSYNPKWEPTFAKYDAADGFYHTKSVWAFFFVFFYYFYLRMWRKGFIILGLSFWGGLATTILYVAVGPPNLTRFVGFASSIMCTIFAERDYYLFKRHGEKVWPSLKWLENPWVLAAFVIVPFVAMFSILGLNDDDSQPSEKAAEGSKVTEPSTSPVAQQNWQAQADPAATQASPVERPTRVHLTGTAAIAKAEKNCSQWLRQIYGGSTANPYDQGVYTYEIKIQGGEVNSNPIYFGGHPMMHFKAQLWKYKDKNYIDSINIPQEVCVMNDDLQVIGVEISEQDGVR